MTSSMHNGSKYSLSLIGVVGGNGFRIVVDDDRFIAAPAGWPRSHGLWSNQIPRPGPMRIGPEPSTRIDGLSVTMRFVFLLIGGIEVRDIGARTRQRRCRSSYRPAADAVLAAPAAPFPARSCPRILPRYLSEKPKRFALRTFSSLGSAFTRSSTDNDVVDLIKEERVDLGRIVDQHHVNLTAEQLGDRIQPFIGRGR